MAATHHHHVPPAIRSREPFDLRKEDDFTYIFNMLSQEPLPENVPVLDGIAPAQPVAGDVFLWRGILGQNALIPVDHYKWRFYGRTLAPKQGDSRVEKIFMRGTVIDTNGQRGYLKDIKKHVYRLYASAGADGTGGGHADDPSQPQRIRRCLVHYLNTPTVEMANNITLMANRNEQHQNSTATPRQIKRSVTASVAAASNKRSPDSVFPSPTIPTDYRRQILHFQQQQPTNGGKPAAAVVDWTSRNTRRRRGAAAVPMIQSSVSVPSNIAAAAAIGSGRRLHASSPLTSSSSLYSCDTTDDQQQQQQLIDILHSAISQATEPIYHALEAINDKLDVLLEHQQQQLHAASRDADDQQQADDGKH